MRNPLVDALISKGFKADESSDSYETLKKGDCELKISSSDDGKTISVVMRNYVPVEEVVEAVAVEEE